MKHSGQGYRAEGKGGDCHRALHCTLHHLVDRAENRGRNQGTREPAAWDSCIPKTEVESEVREQGDHKCLPYVLRVLQVKRVQGSRGGGGPQAAATPHPRPQFLSPGGFIAVIMYVHPNVHHLERVAWERKRKPTLVSLPSYSASAQTHSWLSYPKPASRPHLTFPSPSTLWARLRSDFQHSFFNGSQTHPWEPVSKIECHSLAQNSQVASHNRTKSRVCFRSPCDLRLAQYPLWIISRSFPYLSAVPPTFAMCSYFSLVL